MFQLVWLFSLIFGCCLGLEPEVYSAFESVVSPCIRVLNSSSAFGCLHSYAPVQGLLYYYYSPLSDIPKTQPVILVMPASELTVSTISQLQKNISTLAGIMVPVVPPTGTSFKYLNERFRQPSSFSDDVMSSWNPYGRNLLSQQLKIPIFAVLADRGPDDVDSLTLRQLESALSWNIASDYVKFPLHNAILNVDYYASDNAAVCLRRSKYASRSFCNPAGGHSIVASTISASSQTSALFVGAQVDSKAFFDVGINGMNSYVSAVVSLLGAARELKNVTGVVWGLFDGDSWDLSGSRRFFEYQELFSGIDLYFDAGSVLGGSQGLFVDHSAGASSIAQTAFSQVSGNFKQQQANWLPMSSLTSAKLKYGNAIDFVRIGDNSTDPFRNSVFDDPLSVDKWNRTCFVSQGIVNTILTRKGISATVAVNCTRNLELMECLSRNFSCPLVQEFIRTSDTRVNKNTIFTKSISSYTRFLRNYMNSIFVSAADIGDDCTSDLGCTDGKFCSKFKCTTSAVKLYDAYPMGISRVDDGTGPRYTFAINSKSGSSFIETESGLLSLFSSWTYSNYGSATLLVFQTEDPNIDLALFLISLIYASSCTFIFIGVKKRYALELP